MKFIPLLGPAFETQTPESLYAYIKSLVIKDKRDSQDVEQVGIDFKRGRTTVRVKRDPKLVTRDEVAKLAKEYEKDELMLIKLFKSRKVGVLYADSDERREADRSAIQAEKDAKRKPRSYKRKISRKHKLQLP